MSPSRYISRILGGALIPLIAIEVRTLVKVTNIVNHAVFGDFFVEGFSFCEG